jgi:transposase
MEQVRCLGECGNHPRRADGREWPLQHRQHYGPRPYLGSGRKRGTHQRALGRSRGGFTSKIHCLADARGRPIAFLLTPGEAADCKAYETLIELPEQTPDALLADKAYDTDDIRGDLKERRIKAVIPPKSNRKVQFRYDKRLYRERNWIERMIGHLKINRSVATRYDQLAETFLGMLNLAAARYWIKFVHAA